ncbi:MAG: hypothetical protein WAW10_07425 [Gallionella sp.]
MAIDCTQLVSVDRMTAEDKGFLIQSLAEFCACYEAYLGGDFPEFVEMTFHTKVGETQLLLNQLLDNLLVDSECPLHGDA